MRLLELRVSSLPGVEQGFSIEAFAPGVNIVLGPNASGKSRMAHALRCLLDPSASKGEPVHVAARFDDDGVERTAERLNDQVHWRADGAPSAAPALPDAQILDAWFLRLEDLTDLGSSDRAIARRLATELAGGIDLPAVRSSLVTVGPKRFAQEKTAFVEAREQRRAAERAASRLVSDHEEVDERTRALEEAIARAARAPKLEAAAGILDAQEELAAVDRALRGFPPAMDRLHDDAWSDAERWRDALRSAEATIGRHEQSITRLEADAAATGLEAELPREADVRALAELVRDLDRYEARAADAEERVAASTGPLRSAVAARGEAIDGPPSDDAAATIPGLDELDELDRLDHDLRALERDAQEVDRRLRSYEAGADDEDAPSSPDRLEREARDAHADAGELLAWIAAPDERRRWLRPLAALAWTIALILAVVAAVSGAGDGVAARSGGTLGGPAGAAEAFLAALDRWLAGSLVAAAVALLLGALDRPRIRRSAIRRRLEQRGTVTLDRWDEASVAAAADEAVRRAAVATRRREDAIAADRRRRELLPERDRLERSLADATARYESRLRAAGLDPDRTGRSALERARRARIAMDAAAVAASERERRARALEDLAQQRARIEAAWHRLGPLPDEARASWTDASGTLRSGATSVELLPLVDDLQARVETRDDALRRAAEARAALDEAVDQRDHARTTMHEGLARRLGRTPDSVADDPEEAVRTLFERTERHREWRETVRRRELLVDRIEQGRERIVGDDEPAGWIEAGDRASIETARSDAERAAEEASDLREALLQHELEVRTARDERKLDGARRAERRARDALEVAYDEALASEAAAAVLDRVESTYRSERRPATLASAQAWLDRFTHHAYELRIAASGEDATIEARDRRTGHALAPSQLSSGTRAQTLLALRLAHATSAEASGPSLPFVLDEALTTSDEARFAAVIEALAEVVRGQDRQVLYLSARPSDASLWRRIAQRSDGRVLPPTVLDLVELRGAATQWLPPETDAPGSDPPAEPPPPDGLDAEQYGRRLRVPAIDPWTGGATHPFHLLRDRLDLVHRLARFHVEALGTLEALLGDATQRDRLVEPDDAGLLSARAEAARAWLRSWRRGRGEPVDAEALAASGAISEVYLERVVELAEEHEGDGAALIEALEAKAVSGFREAKRLELQAWLTENGYIDAAEPAGPSERALACEQALARWDGAGGVDGPLLARWLEEGRLRRSVRR